MRKVICLLLVFTLSIFAGVANPSSGAGQPTVISMYTQRFIGEQCETVTLSKCVAVAYPIERDAPISYLALMQKALRKRPSLHTGDDICILLTPKRMLIDLDYIKANQYSLWNDRTVTLSFDFVAYAGLIKHLPDQMSCVIMFQLGKLPAGDYRVSVMNGYFEYFEIGKESDAKPVPKTRIHPDTFWYDIGFTVDDR